MILGIDPGLSGALAFLKDDLSLAMVYDMPIMAKGKKGNQVNSAELAKIIADWADKCPITAYLELVSAMPGQGVSSMFGFGVSYGIIQGILGALQVPVILVTPVVWKRKAGLMGKDKDYARTFAQRLYPEADLARKKDIGRADAILIARFGGVANRASKGQG